MCSFAQKKSTATPAKDGIEKIHQTRAGDSGGCSRKLLVHVVPPEMRNAIPLPAIAAQLRHAPAVKIEVEEFDGPYISARTIRLFVAQVGLDGAGNPTFKRLR